MPISYNSVPKAYEAERLNDGLGNIVTAADGKSAVDLKHTQGTDQGLDTGGANEVTAANAKAAVDHAGGTGAPHTAVGVGADATGTAAAGDTAHLGAFAHGDIATNSAARHDQDSDTYLDEGGANEVTAANAKDAVDKKHTQNSDTYLDEGNANEVTAANAKDAVDKKHARSHALDSTSDHTVGAGALGQCIGVVAGPALGWVTPGGGGGGGGLLGTYDFPSTGTKDWQADGVGTEGDWTCSLYPTAFDVCEFTGGELVVELNNSSGSDQYVAFTMDLSAYVPLMDMPAAQVGMHLEIVATSGSANVVIVASFGDDGIAGDPDLLQVYLNLIAGNATLGTINRSGGTSKDDSIAFGAFSLFDATRMTASRSAGTINGIIVQGSSEVGVFDDDIRQQVAQSDTLLQVLVTVPNNCNLEMTVSDIFVSPLLEDA